MTAGGDGTDEPRLAFAHDPRTAGYYERRAQEYDEWYEGEGLFAARDRPGWRDEIDQLVAILAALPSARTLDVACGTGYLTRHLAGRVVGLDRSASMVAIARTRLPTGAAVVADALALPFADGGFDRVVTGHFYGHLPAGEREAFLTESRRVAPDLLVVDSARHSGVEPEQVQERVLNDGSRHRVYKRYLDASELAAEINGCVLLDGTWFVAAQRRS